MSERRAAAASVYVNCAVPITAIFVALKLLGVIAWSWWWVTALVWGPFAVGSVIVLLCGIVWLFADIMERVTKR